jgi:hypothetical protein
VGHGSGPASPSASGVGFFDRLLSLLREVASGRPRGPVPTGAGRDRLAEWQRRGEEALCRGDWGGAVEAFGRAAQEYPAGAVAYGHLAELHGRRGDFPRSLACHAWSQAAGDPGPAAAEFRELLAAVRPFTLLGEARLFALYGLARQLCLDDVPGNFVECGTSRGGSAALLGAVIRRYSRRPRRLYAFDTFTGMPPAGPADRHQGVPADQTPWGTGALAASVEEHLAVVCRALGVAELVEPVPGLFAQTLPARRAEVGSVALLHADADWYESTRQILEAFYDPVSAHGVVQIDDYGFWEGARRAVDDFETAHGLPLGLRWIDDTGVWFRKEDPRHRGSQHWRTFWHLAQAAEVCGDRELARQATEAVLGIVPGLVAAQELKRRLANRAGPPTEERQA